MPQGQSGKGAVLGVLAALLVALAAGSAGADSYSWLGDKGNNLWNHKEQTGNNKTNWDRNDYPKDYGDQATIDNSAYNPVLIDSGVTILLGGGGTALTIGTSAGTTALTISGTLGMQGNISNAKTIVISGTLRNDATSKTTEYTIGGTGKISLQGGTISSGIPGNPTIVGGIWVFNQNVEGYGTISAPVTNNATITASGGTSSNPRTLTISGNVDNTGDILTTAGQYNTLRLQSTITGGSINPGSGTVALSGATLSGTTLGAGTVNTISGTTNAFTGTVGSSATLGVLSGSTLNVNGTLNSSGGLTNAGTLNVSGILNQSNTLTNSGTLGLSGTLNQTGNITNSGTFNISGALNQGGTSGSSYSIGGTASLSLQGGTIGTLSGGGWIFNQPVSGWGTISAPVTNNATITASGGTLTLKDYTFSGGQINPSPGTIALSNATLNNTTLGAGTVNTVSDTTSAFTGTVTSSATLGIVSGSTLNVSGNFTSSGPVTVSGIYNSNGADQRFNTITIDTSGYITATAGSTFTVSGDFLNYSTQNSLWNTGSATLAFITAGSHTLALAGLDYGQVPYGNPNPGYTDNFAWGTLSIKDGGSLTLTDGNSGNGSTALYVGVISGVVITNGVVTNISGDFNIYYDPTLPGNAYLNAGTFKLANNSLGFLMPSAVPLPGSVWLLGSGLVGLLLVCRRRRRRI